MTQLPFPQQPSPVEQQHHRSLVAHYWHYAQQGLVAPLTAPFNDPEYERQRIARKEAVEWATQCGIYVEGGDGEQVVASSSRSESRPLPVVPPQQGVSNSYPSSPQAGSNNRSPLPVTPYSTTTFPTTSRSISLSYPTTQSSSPVVPPHRSFSEAAPNRPYQTASIASSQPAPTPPSGDIQHFTQPTTASLPSSHVQPPRIESPAPPLPFSTDSIGRKRPLPVPPITSSSSSSSHTIRSQQPLIDQFNNLTMDPPEPSSSPSPTIPVVPSFSFNDEPPSIVPPPPRSPSPTHSQPPPPPPIPVFAFNDENSSSEATSSQPPPVPSFSFSIDGDDDNNGVVSIQHHQLQDQGTRRLPPRPRVHPRDDPTHPSHALYHPTSVSSSSTSSSPYPTSSSTSSAPTTTTETTTTIKRCTSCRSPILGRVLIALDQTWHPDCFVCFETGCRERLEFLEFEGTPEDWSDDEEEEDGDSSEEEWDVGSSSIEDEEDGEEKSGEKRRRSGGEEGQEKESLKGKAWCMVHFEERFALQCYHCHTPISSADYLPITDPLLPVVSSSSSSSNRRRGRRSGKDAKTRYYHPLHFFCAGCGDPFLDPIAYERGGGNDEHSTNNNIVAMPYYVRNGHAYCSTCDLRMWREKCPGCRKGIREEDGYVEIGGGGNTVEGGEGGEGGGEGEGKKRKWHEGCFKCSMCSKPLTGIYLLRKPPLHTSSSTSDNGGGEGKRERQRTNSSKEVVDDGDEEAFCGECFDIVAKEEAAQSIVG